MKVLGRRSVHVLLSAVMACLCGCVDQAAPKDEAGQEMDGQARMLQLLEEVKARTPDVDRYQGTSQYRKIKTRLEEIPPAAPVSERILLNSMMGHFELRLGETQKSIQYLENAYRLLSENREQVEPHNAEFVILELAVAYFRLGETENCIHCETGESCIFPIRGGGIHSKQTGSRQAIKMLQLLLEKNPKHLTARWLLNIAYMTLGEYPDIVPEKYLIPPERFASDEEFPRFGNVSASLGVDAFNLAGGAVIDDFDDDGFLDIFTSTWDKTGESHYYHNNGDGTFADESEKAGLKNLYGGLNLFHADYDNDGDIDVLVMRGSWLGEHGQTPNSLLANDGTGRFRDVTFESGLGDANFPTKSAAWSDYDNDGDLDLFVGNENYPCQLFRNEGDGTFTDVAFLAGVRNGGFTKGSFWGDYDGDRFPDLYVANLGGKNRLYHNNGNGTFTDVAPQLGVTGPKGSFQGWFWDFNNDGALDLFVTTFASTLDNVVLNYMGRKHKAELDSLYMGDGKGGFRDVAVEQNLDRVTITMGCNFGDVDYDGFPDFYLGTGYPAYYALMPNLFYHNLGGTGFADVTTASGLGHLQKGHGVSFADLDNDGDQDIYIQLGGAFLGDRFSNALFENPGFGNHWIKIKLVGRQSNRFGVGARIRADIDEDGKRRSVFKRVNTGGSFGGNPHRQEIGLGRANVIERLEVYWPTSNITQEFREVAVDQVIEITEGEDEFRVLECKPAPFLKETEQGTL